MKKRQISTSLKDSISRVLLNKISKLVKEETNEDLIVLVINSFIDEITEISDKIRRGV